MLFVEKNLPKPLDDKEIVEYFIRFQNGDLKSRETIINHNIKLVYVSPLFKEGLVISFVGLVLFLGAVVYYRKREKSVD